MATKIPTPAPAPKSHEGVIIVIGPALALERLLNNKIVPWDELVDSARAGVEGMRLSINVVGADRPGAGEFSARMIVSAVHGKIAGLEEQRW